MTDNHQLRISEVMSASSPSPPAAHPLRLLGILSVLMGFAAISTDFYLPAMPTMSQALQAPGGEMAWTISGYLVGFSFSQLIWGPISDHYGRRLPIALGLVLFTLGSAGCALSNSITALIAFRILQAIGACANVVIARAMVRDLYHGHRAAQMLSSLMTVTAITPLLAPLIGGQILTLWGWRAIFVSLVCVGIIMLGSMIFLPETLPGRDERPHSVFHAFSHYAHLIRRPRLIGYAGAGGCYYAGTFAYISGSPFAYISYHHASSLLYALLFGMGIVGIMAANMINSRLVRTWGSDRLLIMGAVISVLASLWLVADVWTDFGGIWGLFLPLFLFVSMAGFIVANSLSGAMHDDPAHAGTVSALTGAVHYGSGIIGSGMVGLLTDGTPRPMATTISIGTVLSLAFLLLIHKNRRG